MITQTFSRPIAANKLEVIAVKNRTQSTGDFPEDIVNTDQFWVRKTVDIIYDDHQHVVIDDDFNIVPCKGSMFIRFDNHVYIYNYVLPTARQSQNDSPSTNGFTVFTINGPTADLTDLPKRIWKQFGTISDDHVFRILFEKNPNIDQTVYRDDVTTETYCYKIKKIVID